MTLDYISSCEGKKGGAKNASLHYLLLAKINCDPACLLIIIRGANKGQRRGSDKQGGGGRSEEQVKDAAQKRESKGLHTYYISR